LAIFARGGKGALSRLFGAGRKRGSGRLCPKSPLVAAPPALIAARTTDLF
jgi:hypothetical protein